MKSVISVLFLVLGPAVAASAANNRRSARSSANTEHGAADRIAAETDASLTPAPELDATQTGTIQTEAADQADPDVVREAALASVAERLAAPQTTPNKQYVHRPILAQLTSYARERISGPKKTSIASDPNRALFDNGVADTSDPVRVEALAKEFEEALLIYHRVDGRNDHSGLKDVQFPPVRRVQKGDVEGLKAFIKELSSFLAHRLAADGNIEEIHRPVPSDQDRDAFRKQIAKAAARDIKAHALDEFKAVVDGFQVPKIKTFVALAIGKAQEKFFEAPSSSTGKYHPADEINFRGLLVHSIRNVVVARLIGEFLRLKAHELEVASASEIIHDIDKGGIPWGTDVNGSSYAPDHGPIAAKWLRSLLKLAKQKVGKDLAEIIDAVDKHMAQWNKPKPTAPKTLMEQIVSWADYLASLDAVYIGWRLSQSIAAPARKG